MIDFTKEDLKFFVQKELDLFVGYKKKVPEAIVDKCRKYNIDSSSFILSRMIQMDNCLMFLRFIQNRNPTEKELKILKLWCQEFQITK